MSKENEEPKIETNWQPSAEFRFFIYDPEGEPFTYFKSAADRDSAAADIISNYMDDGWAEEVEHVVAGELTHTCQQTNLRTRPDDEELDDEGCDGEGTYWGEFDTFCNYELVPLQTGKAQQLVTPGGGAPGDHNGTKAAALNEVKRMLQAIREGLDCGCMPCMGACRDKHSLEIELEARQDLAGQALKLMKDAGL